jgi:hypothetical protein
MRRTSRRASIRDSPEHRDARAAMFDRASARARRAKKYGQPIYAGAWLDDRTALLAGAAGRSRAGFRIES